MGLLFTKPHSSLDFNKMLNISSTAVATMISLFDVFPHVFIPVYSSQSTILMNLNFPF